MLRKAGLAALLGAAVAAPAVIRSEYLIGTLILIYFFAFVGQGWNVLGGYAGQFSFGHALFFGIGAYTSSLAFIKWGVSPWLGMWRVVRAARAAARPRADALPVRRQAMVPLRDPGHAADGDGGRGPPPALAPRVRNGRRPGERGGCGRPRHRRLSRSEEHTSELQ